MVIKPTMLEGMSLNFWLSAKFSHFNNIIFTWLIRFSHLGYVIFYIIFINTISVLIFALGDSAHDASTIFATVLSTVGRKNLDKFNCFAISI